MAAHMTTLALVALAVLAVPSTHACVYLMGQAKDSVAAKPAGTAWNYAFRGDNWNGVDATNTSWACLSGTKQSPINLQSSTRATGSRNVKTTWHFTPLKSNGSNIMIFNNGHTIQAQWTGALDSNVTAYAATKITDVLDPSNAANLKPVKLTPLQFHFHTTSEHMIDGAFAPIEMHIVHSVPQSVLPGCPASGCLSVVGILMHVDKNLTAGNAALDTIFNVMPTREGVMEYLPKGATLDIEALLPPRNKRSYLQYEGSLTTPPCTEGLLWHVLETPVYISLAQYNAYSKAVGLKQCNETKGKGRHLGEEHHHGHDHGFSLQDVLSSFERGSYSGFVNGDELRQAGHLVDRKLSRKLRADDAKGGTDDGMDSAYTCTVVAYGPTNRNVQPVGNRTVVAYA